jgi:hypothetical protein
MITVAKKAGLFVTSKYCEHYIFMIKYSSPQKCAPSFTQKYQTRQLMAPAKKARQYVAAKHYEKFPFFNVKATP